MTKVKICGVRTPEHALVAAEAGADYVGTIFADESSRKVTPQHAGRIADALHDAKLSSPRPLLVGVFVNQSVALMNDLAETCGLDMIQLSGGRVLGRMQPAQPASHQSSPRGGEPDL